MTSTGTQRQAKRGQAVRLLQSVRNGAQDHPERVSLGIGLLVALHGVTSNRWWPWLNPFKRFGDETQTGTVVSIYLGTAGAAALVAGFAGVVLVFTIGSQSPRVRMFRDEGGRSLQRSWIVVVAEPFVATLCGIVAAVTQLTAGRPVAPWLFELAVVLLAHGAARLLMLLRDLVQIVAADDYLIGQRERTVPLSRFTSAGIDQ
jgi:hypothetical protein